MQPLPDIHKSIDLLRESSVDELSVSRRDNNNHSGGGGQGRSLPGNVLQRTNKGSDRDRDRDENDNNKKDFSVPSEATSSSNYHRSSKQGKSGYNKGKVALLHLLVVDDSGMSRKMLSRVMNMLH